MQIMLTYHDDGKCKHQSHEFTVKCDTSYEECIDVSFSYCIGCGRSKEEAYDDFIMKTKTAKETLNKLIEYLDNISIDNSVKVDCFGKVT